MTQATAKLGRPLTPPGIYASYMPLRQESWDAGSRGVTCLLFRTTLAPTPIG